MNPHCQTIINLLQKHGELPSTEIIKHVKGTSSNNVYKILREMRDEKILRGRVHLQAGRANAIWYRVME